ncbi:unnamed protein product [Effrenium voratum]|nr:unnamed protein product [Effrenium voratum]
MELQDCLGRLQHTDLSELQGALADLSVSQREMLSMACGLVETSEAPPPPPPVDRAANHSFFSDLAAQTTDLLAKRFEERLNGAAAQIRRAYAQALQKEKDAFQRQLTELTAHFATAKGEADVGPKDTKVGSFEEASRLQQQVSALLEQPRPRLDGEEVAYCQATALVLKELLKDADRLREYGQRRLAALSLDFRPKGLTGKEYPVTVHPAVDTVMEVKRRLRGGHGLESCVVKLCTTGDGLVELCDAQPMMDYNLAQELTVIFVDSLVASPLVRLGFEDPNDLSFESVSGRAGSLEEPGEVEWVNTLGKKGVNIKNRGCIVLPEPIQLREEWTISVWTLAPIDVNDHTYRDLVDSMRSQQLIAVILARGKLGNYNSNSFIEGFNVRDLTPGWHHICVVGHGRVTTYYVDGRSVGCKRCKARGEIGVVGNSRGCREAWGYMAEFQIFGVAASDDQVANLFRSEV